MSIGAARVLIVLAASLTGLAGCSSSGRFDVAATDQPTAAAAASPDTTGSIAVRPAGQSLTPAQAAPAQATPLETPLQNALLPLLFLGTGY
jgi:hypothetical protein